MLAPPVAFRTRTLTNHLLPRALPACVRHGRPFVFGCGEHVETFLGCTVPGGGVGLCVARKVLGWKNTQRLCVFFPCTYRAVDLFVRKDLLKDGAVHARSFVCLLRGKQDESF